MKEKKIIWGVFGIAVAVWLLNLLLNPYSKDLINMFLVRKELITLTGVIAFFFMGLIMILAVRPKWLEDLFGGLDKMYYIHKWAGIWAITLSGIHYLLDLSGSILIKFFERGPKPVINDTLLTPIYNFLTSYKGFAKDIAEYTVWIMLIILALTLWNKFSYKLWRYSHKIMGALFLAIAFHALVLTPINYWYQPAGLIILAVIISGSFCAVVSLLGLIGKQSTFKGKIIEKSVVADVVEITCQLEKSWSHQAGQYAFLTHDNLEGHHPFTISSSDKGDNQIRFSVKALGDYTDTLYKRMNIGDEVKVEGPYGRFDFQNSAAKHQVWIAGGVGVTPFIAWLEQMQDPNQRHKTEGKNIDFYYCIRNEEEAIFATRLQELSKNIPNLTLHIYYSDNEGYLTVDKLNMEVMDQVSDIWFCGPSGFAKSLKKALSHKNYPNYGKFHQEYFQMR